MTRSTLSSQQKRTFQPINYIRALIDPYLVVEFVVSRAALHSTQMAGLPIVQKPSQMVASRSNRIFLCLGQRIPGLAVCMSAS